MARRCQLASSRHRPKDSYPQNGGTRRQARPRPEPRSEVSHQLVEDPSQRGLRRLGQVSVDGGGGDVGVAEQLLDDRCSTFCSNSWSRSCGVGCAMSPQGYWPVSATYLKVRWSVSLSSGPVMAAIGEQPLRVAVGKPGFT